MGRRYDENLHNGFREGFRSVIGVPEGIYEDCWKDKG